ncbi:MAG: electron transport complex subunit RsxC [Clostridia bacterium]|nr:electron transport complex subunit RsxC [Clostridia bacterium]
MQKKENKLFPLRPFRTHGGAAVPHHKNTAACESVTMTPPKQVILPMQQHVGAPCTPLVKVGAHVYVGQKIADSDKPVSAPIHASVSGKVSKLTQVQLPGGQTVDAIVIDSDGLMEQDPSIAPPEVHSREDILKAIRESGLVGLGGAGFPTHIKLNVPAGKHIDTLLINGAECEPYITADTREALENSWDVLAGVHIVKEMVGAERVIIGIEANKPEAIKALRNIAESQQYDPENKVRVLELPSHYPQGAEKVLIKACTGRSIPQGGLPADAGCVVMNLTSVAFLARYLKTGMPLVSRRLTVDGSAVNEAKNVVVPIGTPIKDVIEFCGGYKGTPGKILMGGPMMGMALADDELPVLKQNNAVLVFDKKDAALPTASACIRCGRCVSACPMQLMPTAIERQVKAHNADELKALNVMTCMECGSCAFVCPANRPLVQSMRLGKAIVRASSEK